MTTPDKYGDNERYRQMQQRDAEKEREALQRKMSVRPLEALVDDIAKRAGAVPDTATADSLGNCKVCGGAYRLGENGRIVHTCAPAKVERPAQPTTAERASAAAVAGVRRTRKDIDD